MISKFKEHLGYYDHDYLTAVPQIPSLILHAQLIFTTINIMLYQFAL